MIRVDHRFDSMGGKARVTLESETRSEAELERHAAAIRAVIEDVAAGGALCVAGLTVRARPGSPPARTRPTRNARITTNSTTVVPTRRRHVGSHHGLCRRSVVMAATVKPQVVRRLRACG